jgi:hypothetical protein
MIHMPGDIVTGCYHVTRVFFLISPVFFPSQYLQFDRWLIIALIVYI